MNKSYFSIVAIACMVALASCSDKRSTGLEYARNMYDPIAYNPDQVSVVKSEEQDHGLADQLDWKLLELAQDALNSKKAVYAELPIINVNRSVGTILSNEITKKFGEKGLPDGSIRFKFIGTATEADFADLAEKYTTNEELAPGTVVCVSADEDSELKACGPNDFPVGIISTDPAYLMNASADGQAIALKGRVPTRVLGAVNKGDILYASYDGVLIKDGAQKVAIALTTSTIEEEKVVECMIIL